MGASVRLPAVAGAVLAVAGAAVLSSSQVRSAGGGCAVPAGALQTTTGRYLVALSIGPMEQMFSQSEVATKHPAGGEVMLGGAMSDVPGPPAPGRHLEVHICSKDGSQVVQNASPVITLQDTTAGGAPVSLPVAVMRGVGRGPEDIHYGNNVLLPAGRTDLVTVALGGDKAAFSFTMGDEGIVWGAPTNVAAAAAPPAAAPPPARPAPPATAATPSPSAMGSMSPGAMGGMGGMSGSSTPAPAPSSAPAPSAPPGTGAPTPPTGVIEDVAPAGGLGAALCGGLLCVVARRRRR